MTKAVEGSTDGWESSRLLGVAPPSAHCPLRVLFLCPFYRWGNSRTEKSHDFQSPGSRAEGGALLGKE